MRRDELVGYLDEHLASMRFRDYCPNGLQVEGRDDIRRVVCGVTASLALIEAAIALEADALLVHHGWFWKSADTRITGLHKRRMARLLAHDINLIAYHLPLDAHAELGNNAQWAARMGWQTEGRFGEQEIGFHGKPGATGMTADSLADTLKITLGRTPWLVGDASRPVRRIAWCSGGAQGLFEQAIALGVDAYISGEISEQTTHIARETGIPYIAVGHHASERFGVQALAAHLREKFGLTCDYVEIDNPV